MHDLIMNLTWDFNAVSTENSLASPGVFCYDEFNLKLRTAKIRD